jgi:hypothetical protein
MERPGMVATQAGVTLKAQQFQLRPQLAQAPGDQAIGQAATGKDQVVMHGEFSASIGC